MEITDLLKMLGDPRALQERIREAQERVARTTVVGFSGGGMVKITLNGVFEMTAIEISPEVLGTGEVGLLADLVRSAHNDAAAKLRETLQRDLAGAAGGLPIPPDMFGGWTPR
ncbi:MAG TPA: YbaB/EbfC family nucleoid-associated protein [Magnetospirillaceae bacterium]|nr:YbaB/EbfC family nucleoid-associated protein [Magnetospirillaceae bacterium]